MELNKKVFSYTVNFYILQHSHLSSRLRETKIIKNYHMAQSYNLLNNVNKSNMQLRWNVRLHRQHLETIRLCKYSASLRQRKNSLLYASLDLTSHGYFLCPQSVRVLKDFTRNLRFHASVELHLTHLWQKTDSGFLEQDSEENICSYEAEMYKTQEIIAWRETF